MYPCNKSGYNETLQGKQIMHLLFNFGICTSVTSPNFSKVSFNFSSEHWNLMKTHWHFQISIDKMYFFIIFKKSFRDLTAFKSRSLYSSTYTCPPKISIIICSFSTNESIWSISSSKASILRMNLKKNQEKQKTLILTLNERFLMINLAFLAVFCGLLGGVTGVVGSLLSWQAFSVHPLTRKKTYMYLKYQKNMYMYSKDIW